MNLPRASVRQHHLLTRRRFLSVAGSLAAGLALAACGGDRMGQATPNAPTPSPTPEGPLILDVPGYGKGLRWDGRDLVVTSWGGDYQAAQQRAIIDPFQALTGANVQVVQTDMPQFAVLAADKDAVSGWDVCDVLQDEVLMLANSGVIEPIDYNVVNADGLLASAVRDHAVASSFYSTVLTYRTDTWPNGIVPTTWTDFWNVSAFPGTRGLQRQPQGTLEFALLADGVTIEQLYPLNVTRALDVLQRIRPEIILWWEQGAQPVQMITSGDLAMSSTWHSRISRLQVDAEVVSISWDGGAIAGDSWVIPRNSENADVAMDFINFATRPEVVAAFTRLVPFGPVNEDAFALLPPELVPVLPTAPQNLAKQFVINFDYWFQHRENVDAAFEEWFAEKP